MYLIYFELIKSKHRRWGGGGEFTKIINNISMRWVCDDEGGFFCQCQPFVLH